MAGLGAVAIPLAAACSRDDGARAATNDAGKRGDTHSPPTPKQVIPEPLTGHTPGDLMRQERIDTGIKGARAWRIHYATKDVNDVVHEASGLVIAPEGKGGNRPILTWCHGTTGLGDAACPSAQRPSGVRPSTQATNSGWAMMASFISVLKNPGAMQLTLMPCGPSSAASDRVKPHRPLLAAT